VGSRSNPGLVPGRAWRFIVILGAVSLLADVTYEGARSIAGPFLGALGAGGTAVGVVSGLGEMVGYLLRLPFGWLSDRTGRYWTLTITGYAINLFAVPLLALADRWEVAAGLLVLERFGKAVRSPARDAMLSHATTSVGHGRGFGVHEAMDQIGAMTGPLIVAAVLYTGGDERTGFATLLVPAVLALGVLVLARALYPRPRDLEPAGAVLRPEGFSRVFWIYLAASAAMAAAVADFPLIAFHLGRTSTIPAPWIPTLYALAMGVDAVAALLFGRWYDRRGLGVLPVVALLSAGYAPLVFLGDRALVVAGMVFWGVSIGAQESVMRAAVAGMVPSDRRGTAYGVFNGGFGIAWFLGSAILGVLYDTARPMLIGFAVGMSLLATLGMVAAHRAMERPRSMGNSPLPSG